MAKKETQETRTTIDDLNDTLTKAELKVQDNKKIILWACIGIAAFVCIILLFIYAYLRPAQNKANTAYGQASQKDLIYTMNEGSLDSASAATGLNEVISAYEAAAAPLREKEALLLKNTVRNAIKDISLKKMIF